MGEFLIVLGIVLALMFLLLLFTTIFTIIFDSDIAWTLLLFLLASLAAITIETISLGIEYGATL